MNILKLIKFILILIIIYLLYSNTVLTYNIKITEKTITELFINKCKKFKNKKALSVNKNNTWKSITYEQYFNYVMKFSKGLSKLKENNKSKAIIIGYNSPTMFISVLACMMVNIIPICVYYKSNEDYCNYILDNSKAEFLFVQNNEQLEKFKKSKAKIISFDEQLDTDINYLHWEELIEFGKDSSWKYKEINENTIATILYTSGTTGKPKKIKLTHKNIIASLKNITNFFKNYSQDDEKIISYLPLNHIMAQMMDIYFSTLIGTEIFFADKHDFMKQLLDVKPTIFISVPKIWNKIKNNIKNNTNILTLKPYVAYKLGLDKCKIRITGGAAISNDTKQFFNEFNLPLIDIYGMSETTGPISFDGKIAKNTDVKIKSNVIYVNGHNVFKNKWFNTGDLGKIENNKLVVTGRKKEIIVTTSGENISPIIIEDRVKKIIPEVDECVVIGNEREYLVILLTVNEFISDKYVENNIIKVNDLAETNSHKINKWFVLDNKFKKDDELTNTLKLKRKYIEEKYDEIINKLYI